MSDGTKCLLGLIIILPLAGIGGLAVYWDVSFNNKCGGRLKRAADANTVEMAKEELGAAVTYLESNQMTEGYTSIIYRTPDEDIGFWYKNLKASLGELDKVSSETPQMERTNVLMKLRETLLDKDSITKPPGIEKAPYNTLMAILLVLCAIPGFIGAVLIISVFAENS